MGVVVLACEDVSDDAGMGPRARRWGEAERVLKREGLEDDRALMVYGHLLAWGKV